MPVGQPILMKLKKNNMAQLNEIKNLMSRIGEHVMEKTIFNELYNINNTYSLQTLNEETLSRIINKHGKDGFIIVSANRSGLDNETNNKNTKNLINDLKISQYGYFPVYGGYHGTDGVVDSYEPSFIVFNHTKNNGELTDFSDLKLFAIQMCGKYNQDSVLIKEPNTRPYYINKDGEIVGKAISDDIDLNNPNNEYYTSMIKSNNLDYKNPERLKRFSYPIQFECYMNPCADTLNELRRRKEGYGEIVFNFGNKEIF